MRQCRSGLEFMVSVVVFSDCVTFDSVLSWCCVLEFCGLSSCVCVCLLWRLLDFAYSVTKDLFWMLLVVCFLLAHL